MAYQARPRDPLFDSTMSEALEKRGKELIGFALITVGLLLTLMLLSFNADDPSFLLSTDAPVQNWLGRYGALISALVMMMIGYGGWALALALVVWGGRFVMHRGQDRVFPAAVYATLWVALVSVYAAGSPLPEGWQMRYGMGGIWGETAMGFLLSVLPISASISLKILQLLLGLGALVMGAFVLGFTRDELGRILRFLMLGTVMTYATLVSVLGRGASGAKTGAVGAAQRVQTAHADRRARRAVEIAEAEDWAASQEDADQTIAFRVHRSDPVIEDEPVMRVPAFAPTFEPMPEPPMVDPMPVPEFIPEPVAAKPRLIGRMPSLRRKADKMPEPELVSPEPISEDIDAPEQDRINARIADAVKSRRRIVVPSTKPPVDPSKPLTKGRGFGPRPLIASMGPLADEPPLAPVLRAEPPITAPAQQGRVEPPISVNSYTSEDVEEYDIHQRQAPVQTPEYPPVTQPASRVLRGALEATAPVELEETEDWDAASGLDTSYSEESAVTSHLEQPYEEDLSSPDDDFVEDPYTNDVSTPDTIQVAFDSDYKLDADPADDVIMMAAPLPASVTPPARPSVDAPIERVDVPVPEPKNVVQQPQHKVLIKSRRAREEAEPNLPFTSKTPDYELPPLNLLAPTDSIERHILSDEALEENARMLETVLDDYGVKGEIVSVRPGPVVTMYELEPAAGLKASRVIGLSDDIARSMSALSARVSTVPGRSVIGIELPNEKREMVSFRELLSGREYADAKLKLPLVLGKDIGGDPVVANLAKMPHLLIAGTTGSGKSVAINTMILSLLYRLTPDDCRLIMIDPKMLELSVYDGIPHLLSPVVTDPKKAVVALKWVVGEMEDRYRKMSKMGVRNIDGYNGRVADTLAKGEMFERTVQTGFDDDTGEPIFETEEIEPKKMPYIVVVVDEMADLMMVAGKEIEACMQRLAQMARASGIHLIMATQRPSVDVITGTLKANFPTRISFQVTSKIDSRTILSEMGAEQLLGMGDMLFMASGSKIIRAHGPFVADEEVEEIVNHLKAFGPPEYIGQVVQGPDDEKAENIDAVLGLNTGGNTGGEDALYDQAVAIAIRDRKCSTSYIQRKLGIGYNKAARLVEQMEDQGVVSAANHVGKREILVPEQ